MTALILVSNRINRTHIASPKQFRINLPEFVRVKHTGQWDRTALVYRIIPCIAKISFVGNDWAKILAILNVALHSAIWIPVNFLRLRIIVAHFAKTVSEHVVLFACNRTGNVFSYVLRILGKGSTMYYSYSQYLNPDLKKINRAKKKEY